MSIELLTQIMITRDENGRGSLVKQYLEGEISLTDLYGNYERGGCYVLEALEVEQKSRTFADRVRQVHLRVLCDSRGNPVKPGDTVTERWDRSIKDSSGKYASTKQLNMDKLSGEYNDKWTQVTEHIVDAVGCITMPLALAQLYILAAGVHWRSAKGVCRTPVAKASAPAFDSETGAAFTPHYWRYQEVLPNQYISLMAAQEAPLRMKSRNKKETENDTSDSIV